MEYLEQQGLSPKRLKNGRGADIICGGKFIDVKGCMKTASSIRMNLQPLKKLKETGNLKQGSFFIYYVFDMASGKPKLKIFDFDTFQKFKRAWIVWEIQPKLIEKETGNPNTIDLLKERRQRK